MVLSSAEAGDEVANKILHDSVLELASCVKAVVQKLTLCGEGTHVRVGFFYFCSHLAFHFSLLFTSEIWDQIRVANFLRNMGSNKSCECWTIDG